MRRTDHPGNAPEAGRFHAIGKGRILFAFVVVWLLFAAIAGALWWLLDRTGRMSTSDWLDLGIGLGAVLVGLSWALLRLFVAEVRAERAHRQRRR